MRFSLDTNSVITVMNGRVPMLRDRVATALNQGVGVSSVAMIELAYGAFNSERVLENLRRIAVLEFTVLDFDLDDARAAGSIRAELKKAGTPIGHYDLLIAGQALARNLVVVTANVGEFARVQGLRVEDWTVDR